MIFARKCIYPVPVSSENAHPGYLFSYKYGYQGAYFNGIIGTRVSVFLMNIDTLCEIRYIPTPCKIMQNQCIFF